MDPERLARGDEGVVRLGRAVCDHGESHTPSVAASTARMGNEVGSEW
jgi:hypothetical protein